MSHKQAPQGIRQRFALSDWDIDDVDQRRGRSLWDGGYTAWDLGVFG